jgi:hypothetical protein
MDCDIDNLPIFGSPRIVWDVFLAFICTLLSCCRFVRFIVVFFWVAVTAVIGAGV